MTNESIFGHCFILMTAHCMEIYVIFPVVLLHNCELAIVVVAVGRKMLEMNEESSRSSPMTQ
jgi:hypothetical protein